MDFIQSKVDDLSKKYGTRNPFELAEFLNINVIHWDLHDEINGFYQYEKRNQIIFLNNNLSNDNQCIVCAHELGHAVLHRRSSVPFMRANTLFSIDKIEVEANKFAAYLLIPDESLFDSYEQTTIYDIATLYNVPVELAELKFKGLF
ncbi:ImmA/IrrE family metallo-endopeptidase [Lysinibacillus sp. NPDC058147]|uniref:ImmA/IrrE family metallo-endopeptidase n=1 Tax=unclassified Lysinibacillus TaxID=2636778 RepID=UPI0036D9864F